MFDTHCHLNFAAFEGKVKKVIGAAREVGVNCFVVPGTDLETSQKALTIASNFSNVYAAVGIHPHHVYQYQISKIKYQKYIANIKNDLKEIEKLLTHSKVVAIGEIGLDRHYYQKTKYPNYQIDEKFIELQKIIFLEQLKLAKKYQKAVVIHNREAKKDLLEVLTNNQSLITNNRLVFHCCEPDDDLLEFAKKHKIFIGVDGDVTYHKKKQEFVKKIPLELLVLETDSPFLTPVGFQNNTIKKFPNEPKNLVLITQFIAKLKNLSFGELTKTTTENAKRLFGLI